MSLHQLPGHESLLLAVGILVVATIAIATVVVVPRIAPRRLTLDGAPDRPLPFGRDMSWLAIQSSDTTAVVEALGLTGLRAANWNSGVGAIYDYQLADEHVFVAPPIKGWTIVAGVALPLPASPSFVDKTTPLMQHLASVFPNVQYFATFPIIDFFAWARHEKGRLSRSFAIGEAGIITDRGRMTAQERRLGLTLTELRGIRERHGDVGGEIELHPTEPHVLAVAGGWSINPMAIEDASGEPGVGWIGLAPQSWRPERRRRAA